VGPSDYSSPPVVSQAGYGPVSPSALSKEGQRGRRCLFIIGVGAGKYLGYKRESFQRGLFVCSGA